MKKFVMLCVVCSLLLSLCACGQSTSGQADSAEQLTWQEQYDLGVRYLSDGNYEEAIIAFTAAIEIDPKRSENYVARGDAYVGYAQTLAEGGTLSGDALEAYENAAKDYRTAIRRDKTDVSVYRKAAEVYIILGDTDSARDVIEKGLRNTEDESLRDLLDELTGVVAAEDLTEGSAEWQALEAFLWRFNECYGDYDCETATVPDSFSSLNILERMLVGDDFARYCYDDTLYPGEMMEEVYASDPLGKFYSDGPYTKINATRLDWILEHIFNCSPEDIASMKEPITAGQNENVYYLDGYYYFFTGGMGHSPTGMSITKIEPVGMRYYVEYYFYDDWNEFSPTTFHRAIVSLKEIDGKTYWSLYYNGDQERDEDQQLTEDEAYKIAYDYWNWTWGISEGTDEIYMRGTYPDSDGTDYYCFELGWFADAYRDEGEWAHFMSEDIIYINSKTGKIVRDI